MSKRISIWTYGGVGVGHFSQGYPMLVKIIESIARDQEIILFSYTTIAEDFKPRNYRIISPPKWISWGWMKWVYLIKRFFGLHVSKKFHLLFAFWGYPSGFLVTLLGKLLRLPIIVNILGAEIAYIPDSDFGLLGSPLRKRLVLWTLRNCQELMTISEFQASIIRSYEIRRPLFVVPWGADPALFKFEEKGWSDLKILHVANLNPVKDQKTLLRAFALIRKNMPCKLKIVGADFMDGALQRICKELGVEQEVKFEGIVPYHQMPAYYSWANMMLHTSVYEGQCMAITEALAGGLLLAGTKVGILYDLGPDCSILTEPGDYKNLAHQIIKVLQEPEERDRLIANSKKWSEVHNLNWTVQQFNQIINRAISGYGR